MSVSPSQPLPVTSDVAQERERSRRSFQLWEVASSQLSGESFHNGLSLGERIQRRVWVAAIAGGIAGLILGAIIATVVIGTSSAAMYKVQMTFSPPVPAKPTPK